jgi:cysteine-rich repeat protein
VCGNGKLETGESCDENDFGDRSCASELKNANAEGSLLCSNNCTISTASCFIPPYCGDGIKQDNEECDDGNGDNTDACTSACKATCAGPGYFREEGTGHCYVYSLNDGSSWQNAREECFKLGPGFDLAALSTADELEFVLKSLNTLPTKSDEIWIGGNDLKKEGEYAWTNGEAWNYPINQPPWLGPPHPSSSYDCLKLSELMGLETGFCLSSRPFLCERRSLSENLCRDGNINPNVEECDDGNASNSDACINSCQAAKCGDGFTRTGVEECDDGNASNTDSCTTECKAAKCGDGFVRTGVEECDDGNQVNTDACVTGCKNAACGDGFVRAGVEECDDGNQVNTDACIQGCKAAQCGDGFVQAGVEQCDDGNLLNGDGCNSACSGPLGRSVPGAIPGLRGGKKSVSLRDAIRSS